MKENKMFLTNPNYDLLGETLLTMPEYDSFSSRNFGVKEVINKVYHCSNERLNSYFKDLKLKNARIATVGSSGDQVLNAIFYGAKDITLIDANIFTRAYFEYKTAMIRNLSFDEFKKIFGSFYMFNWKTYSKISHDLSKRTKQFFDELMLNQDDHGHDYDEGYLTDSLIRNSLFHTPCHNYDLVEENLFYNNEEDYLKLRKLLIKNDFKLTIINAELKEFPSKLKGQFDYIFLSNIYDYVDRDSIISIINKLYKKLNAGGAIQYHYELGFPEHKCIKSKDYDKTGKRIILNENLITKKAYLKTLEKPKNTYQLDHQVYFIEKKENEILLELNI